MMSLLTVLAEKNVPEVEFDEGEYTQIWESVLGPALVAYFAFRQISAGLQVAHGHAVYRALREMYKAGKSLGWNIVFGSVILRVQYNTFIITIRSKHTLQARMIRETAMIAKFLANYPWPPEILDYVITQEEYVEVLNMTRGIQPKK